MIRSYYYKMTLLQFEKYWNTAQLLSSPSFSTSCTLLSSYFFLLFILLSSRAPTSPSCRSFEWSRTFSLGVNAITEPSVRESKWMNQGERTLYCVWCIFCRNVGHPPTSSNWKFISFDYSFSLYQKAAQGFNSRDIFCLKDGKSMIQPLFHFVSLSPGKLRFFQIISPGDIFSSMYTTQCSQRWLLKRASLDH